MKEKPPVFDMPYYIIKYSKSRVRIGEYIFFENGIFL